MNTPDDLCKADAEQFAQEHMQADAQNGVSVEDQVKAAFRYGWYSGRTFDENTAGKSPAQIAAMIAEADALGGP